ncbi:hypothetical protein CR513_33583, partial [Mucuna pruriens]
MSSASLENQIPHSILFPKDKMYHVPPKVFGCVCFVHDVSPSRDKLSSRAIKCVFLGYSHLKKGHYQFYILVQQSRHKRWVPQYVKIHLIDVLYPELTPHQILFHPHLPMIHLIHVLYPKLTPHRILFHPHLPMILTLVSPLLFEKVFAPLIILILFTLVIIVFLLRIFLLFPLSRPLLFLNVFVKHLIILDGDKPW